MQLRHLAVPRVTGRHALLAPLTGRASSNSGAGPMGTEKAILVVGVVFSAGTVLGVVLARFSTPVAPLVGPPSESGPILERLDRIEESLRGLPKGLSGESAFEWEAALGPKFPERPESLSATRLPEPLLEEPNSNSVLEAQRIAWMLRADDTFFLQRVVLNSGATPFDAGVPEAVRAAFSRCQEAKRSHSNARTALRARLGLPSEFNFGGTDVPEGPQREERLRRTAAFEEESASLRKAYERECSDIREALARALSKLSADPN